MEYISLKEISTDSKIRLLKELGYNSDGEFVTNDEGKRIMDHYVDEEVKVDNMLIFPGSTVILDDNPLSIACYLEEYGDL